MQFDVDGDGRRQRTGWVGRDDGLLVLDRDGDGVIGSGREIAFISDAPGARSDLEGLAAFDTNRNGSLDVGDESFSSFRIWRDANQDGVSQARELRSLAAWGIESLNLSPSATFERTPGSRDNAILGTTEFVRRDGSVGVAGDVTLSYDREGTRSHRLVRTLPAAQLDHTAHDRRWDHLSRQPQWAMGWRPDQAGAILQDGDVPLEIFDLGSSPLPASARELARGMYGEPQLETESEPLASPSSAQDPAREDQASERRITMFDEPQFEVLLEAETPSATTSTPDTAAADTNRSTARALLEAIRNARYVATALGGWRTDPAVVLQDEDSATHMLAPTKRPQGSHNREVLQMIDHMAAFNAGGAGLEIRGRETVSPLNIVGLVVDARAA